MSVTRATAAQALNHAWIHQSFVACSRSKRGRVPDADGTSRRQGDLGQQQRASTVQARRSEPPLRPVRLEEHPINASCDVALEVKRCPCRDACSVIIATQQPV
eukprot:TRINITY_DN104977_c0_g1_i1.p3 TRINITY_DN104977_c0_g1~~TRINITY_DN104977_c0_g1_i1.p3  ORF type:complete len:103 (-),score=1.58 TRINITY_DN104977_c0_g1_i1:347-655(-)